MNASISSTKRSQYVKEVLKLEARYKKKGDHAIDAHLYLQLIILIGATTLPFILNIPIIDKITATIISITVAVAAALSAFMRAGDHARNYYIAAAKIRSEYHRFDLNREPYKSLKPDDALTLFIERIDRIQDKQIQSLVSSNAYGNVSFNEQKELP